MLVLWVKLHKGNVATVCDTSLNQDKYSQEISLNFTPKISLSVKGKVKRNLLTKISLVPADSTLAVLVHNFT